MAMLVKDTILRNKNILQKSDSERILSRCSSSAYLSTLNSFASTALYGYPDSEQYFDDLSSFGIGKMSVPTLIVQPQDDPLHGDFFDENIDVDKYVENERVVFYAPPFGNHFGFYEGSLLEAFSCKSSYTYPANIALGNIFI
jgi:predicted alpha/beta-fold hydrolase